MAKPKKNTKLFKSTTMNNINHLNYILNNFSKESSEYSPEFYIKENSNINEIKNELSNYQKRIDTIDKQIEESYKKYSGLKNKKLSHLKRVVRGVAKNIGTLGFINLANKQKMDKGLGKHNDDLLSPGDALIARKNRLIKLREENLAKFNQLSALADKKLGKGNEVSQALSGLMRSERIGIAQDKIQVTNFSKKVNTVDVNEKGKKVTTTSAKPREWKKENTNLVLNKIEPNRENKKYINVMFREEELPKLEALASKKLKTSGKKSFVKKLEKASKKNEAKLNEIKAEHPTYKGKGKKGGISMGWFGGR